jgi:hypothetical protein
MWTFDRIRSLLPFGLAITFLIGLDLSFAYYARSHFLPARKLEVALSATPVDALILGDSRMAAALDVSGLREGWRQCGGQLPTVADLSLGGVDIDGQAMAVRQFFERGGTAKLVVLGTVPESLTSEPADPEGWIGNEAIVLWWSRLSDVAVHFPRETTRLDPDVLDREFRFLTYRTLSLSSLRSLLWHRAQELQDVVLRRRPIARPIGFGAEADMRALAGRFTDRAHQVAAAGIESWRMSAWACELRREVEVAGSRLLVVELPMPSAYQAVQSSAFGQELRRRLPACFCGNSVAWIDASSLPVFSDSDFSDGLHLSGAAGRAFSTALGCRVSQRSSALAPSSRRNESH